MQELRQMTEAGIPVIDLLIKKFKQLGEETITAGDIFDKISNREVPFAMIKEMFEDMTSEGGMFFNMQELQATSLAGKISNLRDAYDIMLDSIGSANSGVMKGAVDGLVKVMDNWDKYWTALKGIILTYGVYKAAIIAVNVAKVANVAINELVIATAGLVNRKQAAQILLTDKLTTSWGRLNKAMMANKWTLIVTALFAIGYAIKSAYDEAHKLEKALDAITGKTKSDADASVAAMDMLLIRLLNANQYSKEYKDIIAEINKKYGEFLPNLIKESEAYSEIKDKLKDVTAAIYEKAKAQAYSQSVDKMESELSEEIAESYKSAIESLTKSPMLGYGNYVLSKDQANKVVAEMFASIRNSPEIYKQSKEVEKLISESMAKAYTAAGRSSTIKTSFFDLYDKPQLHGMIDGVKDYAKAYTILPDIQKAHFNEIEACFGANINYANSIEQIQQKYEKLNAEANKISFKSEAEFDTKQLENHKNMLLEMIAAYELFKQFDLAAKVKKQYDELTKANEGWRVELNKILSETLTITTETNFNEVVKEIKDKYKEVKERIEQQKPILVNMGLNTDSIPISKPMGMSESKTQMINSFEKDIADMERLLKAIDTIGLNTKDWVKPKGGSGSKKDKFTDGLKKEVELIKDARKQYDDLRKVMSKGDAFDNLHSIPEYQNVKQVNITDEGYVDYLREQLKKIEGRNTEAAKSVRITWNKELGEIQITKMTKEAQNEITKIEKYLSGHKEKFNLYKQVFDITGDKGQAAQMAFGDSTTSVVTYIDAMKEKLKEMSGGGIYEDLLKVEPETLTEPVRKMVEDISQAIQEKDFALKLDMSKIIADYATTQEKIDAIKRQYDEKREKAKNSKESEDEINKTLEAYDKAEAESIAQLQEQLFQLTPFYRQLFGELSDISYRHLKKMVADTKVAVSDIATIKNDDGRQKYGKYNERNGKLEGYYMPNEDGSISNVLINLKQYEKIISRIATLQKDMRKENPFDSLLRSPEEYKVNEGTEEEKQMGTMDIIASKATDLNSVVQSVTGGLSDMFDALGNESAADASAFVGEMVGAAANIAGGIASGNPVMVIQGIVGGITSIAKNHDKKLDRAIEKSKLKVKELQGAYSELERFLERQLGAVSQSQAKEQIKNLEAQRKEIESQMSKEKDKKKTNWGAVSDYENQIDELSDKIRYFYEDLAGEQFGIKIKDWAKDLSGALVDAWAKGEDAAKAFDTTVANIVKNVFKNILQLQYIEPAMKRLREYLFGNDGKGGALGDGVMSQSDMSGLVKELASMKGNLGQWKDAWDYLTQSAKQAGIDLEENVSGESDTLSKGIEAVTEETANMLASYINAMRADLSAQLSFVSRIMVSSEKNSGYFALMQADIMLIQMNTLKTANNTDRLIELSENTFSILRNASLNGSGVKFNIN